MLNGLLFYMKIEIASCQLKLGMKKTILFYGSYILTF